MVFLDTPPESPQIIMDDDPGFIEEENIDEEIQWYEEVSVGELDEGLEQDDDDDDDYDDDTGQAEEGAEAVVPTSDDSKLIFSNHVGSVFCCDIEPKESKLVITGGQDEKAYVWNTSSGEIMFECTNHKDSVSCVGFSHDGMYAATADMSGIIQVWKVPTKTLAWSSDDSYGDLQWMKWHPAAHVLFCGFATGDVFAFKIPSGEIKVLPGAGEKTESGIIMPDGKRFVVGYESGTIKVFDIKSVKVIQHIKSGDAHRSSVTALDAFHDDNLIMSGDLDGIIAFITTATGRVVSVFDTKELDSSGSAGGDSADDDHRAEFCVETIAFYKNPSFPVAISGNCYGCLFIWDVSRQALRSFSKQDCGITTIVWRKDSPVAYLGSLDGSIRIYDVQNNQEVGRLTGHQSSILDLCVSVDGRELVTVSDDTQCRVFDIQKL